VETTAGRLILNQALPEDYGFVNEQLNKKGIAKISAKILNKFGKEEAIAFLDQIERLGFKYATRSGFSISINDFVISEEKDKMLEEIRAKEDELTEYYESGMLTYEERRRLFENAWIELVSKVSEKTWETYEKAQNHLVELHDSGAVPVETPISQISGVRGLVIDPAGKIVELPLRSNYKQGLSSLEYFVAGRGTRKALADVALKTAESGYLTRKLVDVAQDVVTLEEDCNTNEGIYINRSDERRVDFEDRITGRWAAEDIDSVGLKQHDEITPELAEKIAADEAIERVKVRSPLTCEAEHGICATCYGYDLGTRRKVILGQAVGVIAAQAIGEASTQLTLDAKHRSGSATAKDITQGLPRVEELVEVRAPKAKAVLSELDGVLQISEDKQEGVVYLTVKSRSDKKEEFDIQDAKEVAIKRGKKVKKGELLFIDNNGKEIVAPFAGDAKKSGEKLELKANEVLEEQYEVDNSIMLLVEDGDKVEQGQQLTAGSVDPRELMKLKDLAAAQKYIIDEVQNTFGIQGIGLDDKHVEGMVRQMSRYVLISNAGDSEYLPGDYADQLNVTRENERLETEGLKPIKGERLIMGLSNASLRTESFLSAASFQDQVRVLTDASLVGKVDKLRGLKENVIIGRPVPLGDEVIKSEN
ncbi:MAG: DNA-directed RNA polymerase subunit beta', partial [Candidatus Dojkabacteria bacterium]